MESEYLCWSRVATLKGCTRDSNKLTQDKSAECRMLNSPEKTQNVHRDGARSKTRLAKKEPGQLPSGEGAAEVEGKSLSCFEKITM